MTGNLQALIDKAARGSNLKLEPARCEIQGPIIIRQPLVIVGQGCSIWAEKGPVLEVQCSGVVLNDLNIEVTGGQANLSDAQVSALVVGPKLGITLNNVVVRGDVLGLDGEEGSWRYPRTVRLGDLKADQQHTFTVCLVLPVACQLTSEIAGLEVEPRQLSPGLVTVSLLVEAMKQGTRLRGFLKLRTPLVTRQIQVTCTVQANARAVVGTGQCIYKPDDWDALASARQAPKPPVRSADLTSPPIKPASPPQAIPVASFAEPMDLRGIPEAILVDAPQLPINPAPAPPRRRARRPDTTKVPNAFQQTIPLGETVPTEALPKPSGSTPLPPLWGESPAIEPQPASNEPENVSTSGPETSEEVIDDESPASSISPVDAGRTRRLPDSSLFLPTEHSPEMEIESAAGQPSATATEAVSDSDPESADESKRKKPKRNSGDLPSVFGKLPPKG